jgi:hypothetical protein
MEILKMSVKHYIEPDSKTRKKYMIPNFTNKLGKVLPAVHERFTKEEVEDTIMNNYGIVTIICGLLDCNYKQFYNALDYYKLRGKLLEAKQAMVGLAEEAILKSLQSKNEKIRLKSAEVTLKSLGRDFGWNSDNNTIINQQINLGEKEAQIKNIFGIDKNDE